MKNKFLFLLPFLTFLIFDSSGVSAQKNFIGGYVLSLNKDTVKGQIDYRDWNVNPATIEFMDASGKTSNFSPVDINGFFISPQDHYISSRVSLDLTSFQTKDLVEFQEPRSVKDTALFLQSLVKGRACLYYLKDVNDREHFFVSKDDGPPVELLLKKHYVRASDDNALAKNYVSTLELFKGQLIVLFSDCPGLKSTINASAYTTASLRSLVVSYNNCINSPVGFVRKEENVRVRFGLLAGPTLTRITFKGGDDDLTGVRMSDCYSMLAGVSLHLVFPGNRSQWSLVNELVYKPYSNSASASEEGGWNQVKYDRTFSFEMGYLKLYTLLRYEYPKWKVRPFADLGISNGYAVRCVTTKTVVKTIGTVVKTDPPEPAIEDPKRYEFGVVGGIGVSWWKISGEFRYEWAQGMSPYVSLGGPEKTFFFVIAYLF